LLGVAACGIVCLFVAVLSSRTGFGLVVRGLANNPALLGQQGHNVRYIRGIVFFLSGLIGALAALLSAFGQGFTANSGITMLLLGVVAVILGGRTFIVGPVVAGLSLGIIRSAVTWFGSATWQEPLTFLMLVVALYLQPRRLAKLPASEDVML
jgi:branched-chain amino acid transport system permease protein